MEYIPESKSKKAMFALLQEKNENEREQRRAEYASALVEDAKEYTDYIMRKRLKR